MESRSASCHCGQLVLRCDGEPRKISMCHCLDCQRRTGSPFSVAVFYDRGRITVEQGKADRFERESASGFPVRFHFCPSCGSNVYWEPARLPELIGVAVGAFADPDFPRPEQAVWMKDRHGWIDLPADMPTHDMNPASRPA